MVDNSVEMRYNVLSRQLKRLIARKSKKRKTSLMNEFLSWEKEVSAHQNFRKHISENKKNNFIENEKINDFLEKEKIEREAKEKLNKILSSKDPKKALNEFVEELLFADEMESTVDLFNGMMEIGRSIQEAKDYAFSVWTDENKKVPEKIIERIKLEEKKYE